MNLRHYRSAIADGTWVLAPGEVAARTRFQQKRLTAAVTVARVYLNGEFDTSQIAGTLGVTPERAAQMVRLGISYMREAGWLRPAEPPTATTRS
jgi:hypothetical protein